MQTTALSLANAITHHLSISKNGHLLQARIEAELEKSIKDLEQVMNEAERPLSSITSLDDTYVKFDDSVLREGNKLLHNDSNWKHSTCFIGDIMRSV